MSIKQAIEFWAAKSFILKTVKDENFGNKVNAAYEIATLQPEKFMFDEKLMTFLYASISNQETAKEITPVLLAIFDRAPKKAIARKNLMVTVRRLAIDGHRNESQQAAQILIDRNDAGICLRSVPFMEMLACIASFDIDGTVAKMLNHLEAKQPELCETIPIFLEARENNAESLNNHDENRIDLVEEEAQDQMQEKPIDIRQSDEIGEHNSYRKLWAGPVDRVNAQPLEGEPT